MRGVGTRHNSFERMIQQKNEREIPSVLGHSGPIYPLPIFYILENLGTRLFEGQTISWNDHRWMAFYVPFFYSVIYLNSIVSTLQNNYIKLDTI